MKAWRCPDCGSKATVIEEDLAESYEVPTNQVDAYLMAHGLRPNMPPKVVPVAYDQTLTCEQGHEHHGTRFVK